MDSEEMGIEGMGDGTHCLCPLSTRIVLIVEAIKETPTQIASLVLPGG